MDLQISEEEECADCESYAYEGVIECCEAYTLVRCFTFGYSSQIVHLDGSDIPVKGDHETSATGIQMRFA